MLCETKALLKMLILAFHANWSLYKDVFQGCACNTYTAPKAYNTILILAEDISDCGL